MSANRPFDISDGAVSSAPAGQRAARAGVWKRDSWVRPYFRQYRKVLLAAMALGLATFLFAAALMFTSGWLIGGAAEMPGGILFLSLPLMFVRLFGVGKPVLQYCERLASHDWVLRMTSSLRRKLYVSLEGEALSAKAARQMGDVLGLLAEDVGHVQNLYLRTVFPTVIAWLVFAAVLVIIGAFSAVAALALFLSLAVTTLLLPLVSLLVNGARSARTKALRGELYASLADNVLGVADWMFSGRRSDFFSRHVQRCEQVRALQDASWRFSRRRDLAAQVAFAVGALVVLIWAVGQFGGQYGGASNWILAFVLGYFPLIDAFAPLSAAAEDAGAHEESVRRLNELPSERAVADSRAPQAPFDILVEDVAYRYPDMRKDVLCGIDLFVRQGEKVAILGRSGSGKSTLARLLRGDAAPTSGRVLVGGVDASAMGDAACRAIGVIQQDTYLFNATLRDNVALGAPSATDEEIREVLGKVGLDGLLARLPEGLDTLVDEAGLRFSGGERHRIALARVLLQDVPIVLLDEPTVGLDPATERALLETLFDSLEGKTLVMITHHLQGVSRMDCAVFLEDGRVALEGAPEELSRTSERYRRLLAFDRGFAG